MNPHFMDWKASGLQTYTERCWRPRVEPPKQTISKERLPWKRKVSDVSYSIKFPFVFLLNVISGVWSLRKTYWRVSRRIPFWTFLPRTDASRPSPERWPTKKRTKEIHNNERWQFDHDRRTFPFCLFLVVVDLFQTWKTLQKKNQCNHLW